MSIYQLLLELKKQNINIQLYNGDLKLQAPKGVLSPNLVNEIKKNKQEIITFLSESLIEDTRGEIAIVEKKEYYEMSSAQHRLYFLHQLNPISLSYNVPEFVRLEGKLDKERLEDSFKGLIQLQESLRTSFILVNNTPKQKISDKVDFKLEYYKENENADSFVKEFVRPFNLGHAPLFRAGLIEITPEDHILMVDIHHIVSDGSSNGIMIKNFMSLYNRNILPIQKIQYKDYAEWQKSNHQNMIIEKQKQWWVNKFNGDLPDLDLPLDGIRHKDKVTQGDTVLLTLDSQILNQLDELGKKNGASLFMVLLSVFNILLLKLSNQEDIIIGTPSMGRNHSSLEGIIGMFVNTLTLRNFPKKNITYLEFLNDLKVRVLDVFDNQNFQFEELIEELKLSRNTNRNPLFDVMFVFQNMDKAELNIPGLKLYPYNNDTNTSRFELTLTAVKTGEKINLAFSYYANLFKKQTIESFASYFEKIIYSISSNPNQKLHQVDILSFDEKKQILQEFNQNFKQEEPATITDVFNKMVIMHKDRIALDFGDSCISYQYLDTITSKLAQLLCEQGVRENSIVGLIVNRSIDSIVGLIGIVKTGAAYLPIDEDLPNDRANYIIKDSSVSFVLDTTTNGKDLDVYVKKLWIKNLNLGNNGKSNIKTIKITPDSSSYIIYTSGSTGTPKGVIIPHKNLVNLIKSQIKSLNIGCNERVLLFSPLTFDASVEQLWLPLFTGGRLIQVNKDLLLDCLKTNDYLKKYQITCLYGVPFYIEKLFLNDIRSLTKLVIGGDILSANHIKNIKETITIFNEYGPTETTVTATQFKFNKSDNFKSIPIGKPIAGKRIYILGEYGEIQPIGVKGEICIGGSDCSLGYINNVVLSHEKFIINPHMPGEILYKTGDLGRWTKDGNIEFIGRIDHQVKIRGYRIELGEIERILLNHKDVKECVVVAREEKNEKYLCAYIVFEYKPNIEVLRSYLSGLLPDYMVPSYFVEMDELPLTTNGKINRNVLLAPVKKVNNDYIAPSSPLEIQLVEIWEDVLNISPIGVTDNFYKIGGHSLLSITLLNKIEEKIGERISLSSFLQNLTIRDLAAFISELFSWAGNFHIDNSLIEARDNKKKVKIANLKTKGENPPLFFVAPLGGILPATSIIGIIDLSLLLGENQPFYGVQFPPLFSDLEKEINLGKKPDLSDYILNENLIQQNIAECISSIKDIYKGEKIFIGGFCTGCIFAMELAAQIEKHGFKVQEVFLVDPPLKEDFSNHSDDKQLKKVLDREFNINDIAWFIAKDLGWKEKINLHDVIILLKSVNKEEIWDAGVNILKEHNSVNETTKSQDLRISYYTKFYNQELITTYLAEINYKYPKIDTEQTTLIFAGADELIKNMEMRDIIRKYFKNNITFESVTGDHGTIFQQPHISKLSGIIKNNIKNSLVVNKKGI